MNAGQRQVAGLLALALACAAAAQTSAVVAYQVNGDGIDEPLAAASGDAVRGRELVGNRQTGLCLLCHSGPFEPRHLQGDLAPSLDGVGTRYTAAQLRLRIVNSQRLTPGSVMPAYHHVTGLTRVGRAWQGQPVFDARQVEDVVAYLVTLR